MQFGASHSLHRFYSSPIDSELALPCSLRDLNLAMRMWQACPGEARSQTKRLTLCDESTSCLCLCPLNLERDAPHAQEDNERFNTGTTATRRRLRGRSWWFPKVAPGLISGVGEARSKRRGNWRDADNIKQRGGKRQEKLTTIWFEFAVAMGLENVLCRPFCLKSLRDSQQEKALALFDAQPHSTPSRLAAVNFWVLSSPMLRLAFYNNTTTLTVAGLITCFHSVGDAHTAVRQECAQPSFKTVITRVPRAATMIW